MMLIWHFIHHQNLLHIRLADLEQKWLDSLKNS